MLMGNSGGLPTWGSSKELLLADPVSELDGDEGGSGEPEKMRQILYVASFEELGTKIVKYDTVIWLWISSLLILAWGVGVLMLLYWPFRRYVLRKEIASRKLYVTTDEIIYKVSRPSYIPFWGETKIEKRVPLQLVIDIILEQGCLQSMFGIHTLRVESIAHGKAAPVDELQLHGVYNPGRLTKVIVTQASKIIQEVGRNWKANKRNVEGEVILPTESLIEDTTGLRSPSRSSRGISSPHHSIMEHRGVAQDLVLNKLEEVNKSVKNIEMLIEKSQASSPPISGH
ncbi:OLC1v1039137C4 [Oldenlandia corymbosa var. corymbosa]|uniref:OLC1v1039137C4 n=2 Tax=Oldenlandia corymbosa var. corymbosa TaxID=529605 RepID=A0AAV1D417_OLDCO|nr:OLC1v1039137C4 [Oldenlandia corymbosa var. corymbosa]